MSTKALIWVGVFLGSMIGGLVPQLWGAGLFSFSRIIFSTIGAMLGVWGGYWLSTR